MARMPSWAEEADHTVDLVDLYYRGSYCGWPGSSCMTSKTGMLCPSDIRYQLLGDDCLQVPWTAGWKPDRCWLGSKTSTIRPMVLAAPVVCRLERIRWPVSAAVMAVWIVS